MGSIKKLLYLNSELFSMIEETVPIELLAKLYSTQLVTKGEKHLLDKNRVYYRLLRQIVIEGQKKGEIRSDMPVVEITKLYALTERALLYDWCLCGGEYSLREYASKLLPGFLGGIVPEE